MIKKFIILISIAILLNGCTSDITKKDYNEVFNGVLPIDDVILQEKVSPNEDFHIIITTKGSYDPYYEYLEIFQNGSVIYESGVYFPESINERKDFIISEKELEEILKVFNNNSFFSLDGKYFNNEEIMDASSTETEITIHGKKYSVNEYAYSGPENLQNVNSYLWNVKNKF